MKYLLLVLGIFIITPFLVNAQSQIGLDIDGESVGDLSGYSLSVSTDGSIVAIGAYANDGNGFASGHVRVFENISGTWAQIGSDIDGEGSGDLFGYSVSLSLNGSMVAIGSISNAGYVSIFKNESGVWTQIGSTIYGVEISGSLGHSVSLSSDGTIVAIGAPDKYPYPFLGYTHIYENKSGVWTQVGDVIVGEEDGDRSGWSVSLSSNGSIVAIGAPDNGGNGDVSGHVRVYENLGGIWTQIGSDIDGEASGDFSGRSISLSSDGSIVAIGADSAVHGIQTGHVRVYKNQLGTWTQIGSDIDGDNAYDAAGNSVSLSSDGSTLAVGITGNDSNGDSSGQVRIYKNISGTWTQVGVNINGEAAGDLSGWSVDLSSDRNVVAIGTPYNDGNGEDAGHVKVYDLSSVLSSNEFVLSQFRLFPNPSKNQFTIQLQEELELQKVNIYNNLGQLISSTKKSIVKTNAFYSGIYFVEIVTNRGKASKKIVIN